MKWIEMIKSRPSTSKIHWFQGIIILLSSFSVIGKYYKYSILRVYRYSKSKECQVTWLFRVCSIEIDFWYCLSGWISFIDDVSLILADLILFSTDSDFYDW